MKVFISYRREDSAGYTGRLYDSLRARFGADSVFLDVSGIDSGQKFADVIQNAIRECDVLLAVIGPEWLTCTAGSGRRIDDPADLVRSEITTALQANIPVIPVLVGGTTPPAAASLPVPLEPLAGLDAHEMSDERWAYDTDRLIQAIEKLSGRRAAGTSRRRWIAAAALIGVAAALTGGVLFWTGGATPDVSGEWTAAVDYEWGAHVDERFVLAVEDDAVSGTASFLGVPRRIVDGSVEGDRVTFRTRTQEVSGNWDEPRDVVHQYDGRMTGDTIAFSMSSEGGSTQGTVRFTARRAPSP